MQKYKYKESGIQWLGKIPEHWETTKIKNEFVVIPSNVDKRIEDDETQVKLCNYVDVYYNDFITNNIEFMEATATDHEINKFILNEGDVLITKDSEDPFDIAVAAVVKETQEKLLCGYHLSMIRSINKKISGDFLFWLLKDQAIASQLHREAVGVTRWAIASKHIKNSIISHPPIKEQKVIAEYLEKTCLRIDKIIDLKKRHLNQLEEFFTNRITALLTQGIGNSKLDDTSCLWMPKVKSGWKIKPLKRLLSEKLKYGANESAENENHDEPRYIRITDFDKSGKLKDDTFKSLPHEIAEPYFLSEGDVLFARSGATVGKTFIFKNYSGKACFAGYLIKANCDRTKLLPEFLYYYTKSKCYEEWKNLIFTQATIQNIGADKYQYLVLPVPSIKEQKEIISTIDNVLHKVDAIKEKVEQQIITLIEYKKSIIHECVTGKKQVADIALEKEIKRAMA